MEKLSRMDGGDPPTPLPESEFSSWGWGWGGLVGTVSSSRSTASLLGPMLDFPQSGLDQGQDAEKMSQASPALSDSLLAPAVGDICLL